MILAAVLVHGAPAQASPEVAREVARLLGHDVEVAADGGSYRIAKVADEGAPLVGRVERRGRALYLVTGSRALRLTGPLARPRIAGPGYKVWVLGTVSGNTVKAKRLGVLRGPG